MSPAFYPGARVIALKKRLYVSLGRLALEAVAWGNAAQQIFAIGRYARINYTRPNGGDIRAFSSHIWRDILPLAAPDSANDKQDLSTSAAQG